jgi:hypothetical protein
VGDPYVGIDIDEVTIADFEGASKNLSLPTMPFEQRPEQPGFLPSDAGHCVLFREKQLGFPAAGGILAPAPSGEVCRQTSSAMHSSRSRP